VRERANAFGEAAETYDRHRPGYPDALFDAVVAFGDLQPVIARSNSASARGSQRLPSQIVGSSCTGSSTTKRWPPSRAPRAPALVAETNTWDLDQWADRLDAHEQFAFAERRTVRWVERYTADEYAALMQTHSNHRLLPDAQREALHAAIHAAIHAVVIAHGGAIEVTYNARVFLSRRS
jgi:hypothetical protein